MKEANKYPDQNNNTILWTKNYILTCLSSLILMFGFTALIPTLPIYIEEYGNLTGAAGLPLAALTIGAVLTRPLTGWGLDVYGRRAILFGGLLLFLLPSVIYIGMLPAMLLIFFRFIQGAGFGVGNTALSTVASDVVPLKRMGEGMSIFTVTISLALVAGPAAGLWLVDQYSFSVFFTVVVALIIVSIILMLFVKFPHYQAKEKAERPRLVFMNKKCLHPAMVILLFTLNNSAIMSFISLHALEQGIPNAGIYFTTMAFSTLAIRPYAGRFLDRKGSRGYTIAVVGGVITIVISMLILSQVSTSGHLVGAGIFYGAGFGFIQPAMLALCIKSVPDQMRGAANATYWTAFDLGIAIGSVGWGIIGSLVGYSMMYLISIIPVTAGAFYYFAKKSS